MVGHAFFRLFPFDRPQTHLRTRRGYFHGSYGLHPMAHYFLSDLPLVL